METKTITSIKNSMSKPKGVCAVLTDLKYTILE